MDKQKEETQNNPNLVDAQREASGEEPPKEFFDVPTTCPFCGKSVNPYDAFGVINKKATSDPTAGIIKTKDGKRYAVHLDCLDEYIKKIKFSPSNL